MAAPHPPVLVLRSDDDAVGAFFTAQEAVLHLTYGHAVGTGLAGFEFFDALGRRLIADAEPGGTLPELHVQSEENHAEAVRQRVRRRAQHARGVLEGMRDKIERVDESAVTLPDQDVDFEIFVWRLASVLRQDGSPSDPVFKSGVFGPGHSAGWWHNTFAH